MYLYLQKNNNLVHQGYSLHIMQMDVHEAFSLDCLFYITPRVANPRL